jgi:osmotically-inducible protein OsmY
MANRNHDDEQGYSGRGDSYSVYDREPYYRQYDAYYEKPRSRGYDAYNSEPYRSRYYDRSGYGEAYNESYERGYGARNDKPYWRSRSYLGSEYRGFWARVEDELRSWFGDEEAERRRRMDEWRSLGYVGRGPRGYRRSDERIKEDVNDRLTDDPYLDATDIEVGVDDGVVTLSGTVSGRSDKRRAEDLAESVSGVKDVNNRLRVSRSSQPQSSATEVADATRGRAART